MKKSFKADEVKKYYDSKEIFTRNDYTFSEYADQLLKFQKATADLVMEDEENTEYIRIADIISRCERIAREKNLLWDHKVHDGLVGLEQVKKSIAVTMAGISGEKRVSRSFQYVSRPDARYFKNIYITDGNKETEMDAVIVTKSGLIILEVKNAKEDITIDPDGRILFNNSSCYHDISIGDKMSMKRELLRKRMKEEFKANGIDEELVIDSILVFSTPNGTRIHVCDQFRQEQYCFRGSLFKRIDSFESGIEYSDEDIEKIYSILEGMESNQKRFATDCDMREIISNFAEAFEVLSSEETSNVKASAPKRDSIPRKTNAKARLGRKYQKRGRIIASVAAASFASVASAVVFPSLIGALAVGLLGEYK